jgi:hypothetical protein
MREGLLAVGAGLQVMQRFMEADVTAVCGLRGNSTEPGTPSVVTEPDARTGGYLRCVIKVRPLRLGATKVPFGQFYGGLEGWRGPRALYRYATDKKHFIVVPIHAYLIEHPQDGLILVDAGINWRQTHEHGQYYKGIAHYLFDADEYQLDRRSNCCPRRVIRPVTCAC